MENWKLKNNSEALIPILSHIVYVFT